ncbi:MAG: Phosphomannomutase/phosphoglucomutase [Candidatus Dependentiae bacterium ADurb.Bin331]|nr:MAG: Phosphomannomutase/phosphoglucomutase [Candidatus Dependentiae bacterium ADurb.Bin331]
MNDIIFRQYDIRGKVGSEMSVDETFAIAQAIAFYFIQKNPHIKTVAVGADGRTHSPEIKEQVCRALTQSGLDVVFVGVCPTPVLYFALFTLPVDAGIMITASHNGPEYNGLKICLGKESVWGEQIQEIKNFVKAKKNARNSTIGSYKEQLLIPAYIAWMVDQFGHLKNMQLKAVVDSGNGAGGTVLPHLVKAMNWSNVTLLHEGVDGTYPNHEADPTVEKNMCDVKAVLQTTDTQIGIGLDGDCDRMAAMTKKGQLVEGDKLLALFAKEIIAHQPGAKIVFDIKCSSGLPELLTAWGAVPVMSPSGHSIIKDQMKKNNALLAGELSCHFFFSDRYFGYDDGIYAMMRLFELLIHSNKSLDELLLVFPHKYSTREIRISCAPNDMPKIIAHIHAQLAQRDDAQIITIDGIRANFSHGWAIVRQSNTQPVICLRFEGNTPAELVRIKRDFIEYLQQFIDKDTLEREINQ